ncbi:MAG: hypothetical protein ACXADH_12380 [Candidatus Kariarchaeaceae archaeon]|jgi:hypothetical protein
MPAYVKEHIDESQCLNDMEDGDIAEILDWCSSGWANHPPLNGQVVQRYHSEIIFIGKPSGKGYPTILNTNTALGVKVKILKPGTTLKIE